MKSAWTIAGLGLLFWLAWPPPFGAWASSPVAMMIRAVLLVETIGYIYHRFFQHVGFFTRRSGIMRRNQKFHWIHHMIIYPIGRLYRRAMEYVPAEPGFAWSWIVPGFLAGGLFLAQNGINWGTACFLGAIAVYAKGLIDVTHSRFHEAEHPWMHKPYYNWLEEIHLLHHWDQRYNFTIVHPAMDFLFGTYLAPRLYRRELQLAADAGELDGFGSHQLALSARRGHACRVRRLHLGSQAPPPVAGEAVAAHRRPAHPRGERRRRRTGARPPAQGVGSPESTHARSRSDPGLILMDRERLLSDLERRDGSSPKTNPRSTRRSMPR